MVSLILVYSICSYTVKIVVATLDGTKMLIYFCMNKEIFSYKSVGCQFVWCYTRELSVVLEVWDTP